MPENMKEYKSLLRKDIKAKRKAIPEDKKHEMDDKIYQKICLTKEYKRAKTVLCFVSLANEIDTRRFISHALKNGKKVAVPRCIDGTRLMDFYYIDSLDELSSGSYGVLEPVANEERKFIQGNTDDFMIVPCLSTDRNGYRLGYGGGYYDRFLEGYEGTTAVVAYQELLLGHFWHGKYDLPCDIVITDRMIKYTGGKK